MEFSGNIPWCDGLCSEGRYSAKEPAMARSVFLLKSAPSFLPSQLQSFPWDRFSSTSTRCRHRCGKGEGREGTAVPRSQTSAAVICWGWGHPARKRGFAGTCTMCTLASGRMRSAGASQGLQQLKVMKEDNCSSSKAEEHQGKLSSPGNVRAGSASVCEEWK